MNLAIELVHQRDVHPFCACRRYGGILDLSYQDYNQAQSADTVCDNEHKNLEPISKSY